MESLGQFSAAPSRTLRTPSVQPGFLSSAWPGSPIVRVAGVCFSAVALFGFFWMNIPASAPWDLVYAALALLILFAAFRVSRAGGVIDISPRLQRVWPSPPYDVVAIVAIGVAIRLAFGLSFPAHLESDSAAYLKLAERLLAGSPYRTDYGFAYWPPGFPIALAPFLAVLGAYAGLGYNAVTFVLTEVVAFSLCRRLAGRRAAVLAVAFLAFWPNFIASSALLMKEDLLIVLWPLAVLLYLRSEEQKGGGAVANSAFAGAAIGYATLVQPASILMPGVFIVYTCLTRKIRRESLVRMAALCVCTGLVVAPWTIRNYAVLHGLVPVTSSGGQNFYMVSLPTSDGRWNAVGNQAALHLSPDELRRSGLGFRRGLENIERYPVHYLSTVIRKPLYMYGQDSKNTYWIFDRGEVSRPTWHHALWIVCNVYYLVILFGIAAYFAGFGTRRSDTRQSLLLVMMLAYPILSNAMFEASERHRYGTMILMATFAAIALLRAPRPRAEPAMLTDEAAASVSR